MLAKRGYVVAAIDACFNGDRVGQGPAGPKLDKGANAQELSLFKLYLWLIAPRPHLELSGDQDGGAPTDGIAALEKKLAALYRLYGKGDHFRSVIYKDTGHEYLPEMKKEMVEWFERHLPVK